MQELTLAVVGIDFPNADGSNRRSETMMTLPGESVELVPEPKNKHDSNAIAVISPRGIQQGYVNAERAPYIGSRMSRGEDAEVIFQGMDGGSAFIRVRFGCGAPTLPPPPPSHASTPPRSRSSRRSEPYDPHAFYPDEEGPEWGA
jgi:HIRAN domain